jgi:hypothetical protein
MVPTEDTHWTNEREEEPVDRDQMLEFSATIALPDSGDLLTFHV